MNQDRFSGLLNKNSHQTSQDNLRGFTTNPLGEAVTPAQVLMYQAAFQRALDENQEPEWPLAESWN